MAVGLDVDKKVAIVAFLILLRFIDEPYDIDTLTKTLLQNELVNRKRARCQ